MQERIDEARGKFADLEEELRELQSERNDLLQEIHGEAKEADEGGMDDDERFAGCADLRARVREVRPRLHLFGHIHTQRGVVVEDTTTFVNCTTWECESPPTVVDVDGAVVRVV